MNADSYIWVTCLILIENQLLVQKSKHIHLAPLLLKSQGHKGLANTNNLSATKYINGASTLKVGNHAKH